MRHIIIILTLAILSGCKSQRQLVSDGTLTVDSAARSDLHRTFAVADTAMRNVDFRFDTLEINIQRPVQYAEQPEVIRLRAVRGRIADSRVFSHNQIEDYNRLDTIAYRKSAAESSAEHTATTRIYNPPNGTAVALIALIIAGVWLYIFLRKN